jgi:hypothetical protein
MGFKKGESMVSDRNQGKQLVVVQDLGTGVLYVYKRMSDLAEAAGVSSGTLRNLINRGENEFRGYRVTRVKSWGGIEFGVVPKPVQAKKVVFEAKPVVETKRRVNSFAVMQGLSEDRGKGMVKSKAVVVDVPVVDPDEELF